MTEQDQKAIKDEVLATRKEEIAKLEQGGGQIEWQFSELEIPEIVRRSAYRILTKIGKWTVCLIDQPKKIGVVTLWVILSLLLESENYYYAFPEHVDQIRYEISQPNLWGQPNIPIINGFVIVPSAEEPAPHVPEKEFIANPQSAFTIASLSGLSLQISGKYPHN
jgi:hypothetical protein